MLRPDRREFLAMLPGVAILHRGLRGRKRWEAVGDPRVRESHVLGDREITVVGRNQYGEVVEEVLTLHGTSFVTTEIPLHDMVAVKARCV